eukprot:TRINITY_DN2397_c0_g2_i1.p1 TRINITY_DN2397_c0_g2~~TRINITY_DN2397_c0_g2_i1.p1  ORF type:complete len:434 (+),score=76.42 TRINITY_DN2397_c0_g2_i1:315-1616(+)
MSEHAPLTQGHPDTYGAAYGATGVASDSGAGGGDAVAVGEQQLYRSGSYVERTLQAEQLRRILLRRSAFAAVFCLVVFAGLAAGAYVSNALSVCAYAAYMLSHVFTYLAAAIQHASSAPPTVLFSVRMSRRHSLVQFMGALVVVVCIFCLDAVGVYRIVEYFHRPMPFASRLSANLRLDPKALLAIAAGGAVITVIKFFLLDRALVDPIGPIAEEAVITADPQADLGRDELEEAPDGVPERVGICRALLNCICCRRSARRGFLPVSIDEGYLSAHREQMVRLLIEQVMWSLVLVVGVLCWQDECFAIADTILVMLTGNLVAVGQVSTFKESITFLTNLVPLYYLPRQVICQALLRDPSVVQSVATIDVYAVSSTLCAVACHVVPRPGITPEVCAQAVEELLCSEYNVAAVTVQVLPHETSEYAAYEAGISGEP